MRNLFLFFFLSALCGFQAALAQLQPIGQWREHLDFNQGIKVSAGAGNIFVSSKFGIYSVSGDERNIERFTKVNGLSDIGVRTLRYNPLTEKLLIVYNNSNLDVLYRNDIINIPYIFRSNVRGDKQVNDIFFEGNNAYLSTNLGIIVVNLNRYEINTTWYPGNGTDPVKVYACTSDGINFYAATDKGLKAAPRNANLEDFRSWATIANAPGLPNGAVQSVFFIKGKLFVALDNGIYVRNGSSWTMVYGDTLRWISLNATEDAILLTEEVNNWETRRVIVIDALTETTRTLVNNNSFLIRPNHAVNAGNDVFVADLEQGLIIFKNGSFEKIQINAPFGPLDGEMRFEGNVLYVAGGSVNEAWNYTFNETGFFTYENDIWKTYNSRNISWLDSIRDIISVVKDPLSGKIYAGSYGGGLIEYETNEKFKSNKQGTAIEETVGDPGSYRIGGLAFDSENNLWFSNFGAPRNFGVKKADGTWKKFTVPFVIPDNMTGGILIDDFNQKWIQVPQGFGLYCFNHGNSIDNTGDDRWKWYQTGKNNGNLPGNFVNTMAKDKDGFIWLGTDKGIGIIQCPGEVFTAFGCEVFQPIVQQDNFAGRLFENEDVRAIAVDGGNRKWVGTRNGVWLLSPDGDKVLLRFTAENSPLLSNEISRIAINPQTGEVFFSTFNGICSYRSSATEVSEKNESLLVFPNPVPSSFNGQIGIKGVPENAIIKITELNGRLVFQTRAAGGQAVWNGRDYTGRKPATGVYLILVTDDTGIEKRAGKIVFVK
ncbi:MAG: two-component regulator propeller domain-containing protein [Bacteroidota bacterium]